MLASDGGHQDPKLNVNIDEAKVQQTPFRYFLWVSNCATSCTVSSEIYLFYFYRHVLGEGLSFTCESET